MALSDSRKLDIVFKSRVGREETTTDKAWYEEYPAKTVYPHATEVYAEEIPEDPSTAPSSVIQAYTQFELTEDMSVSGHRSWKAYATPGDTSSERLTHWVHPRFGQAYTVRVYDGNNNEIPTTDASKWFFDYETGILIFEENPTAHGWTLPIKISAYRYVGKFVSDLSSSPGVRDVEIVHVAIPQYTNFNYDNILDGVVKKHLNFTQIASSSISYYTKHYSRFIWQYIGKNSGPHEETHLADYDSLSIYLKNSKQGDEEGVLVLKYKEDSSLPQITELWGYNLILATLKGRKNYYKRFPTNLDPNNPAQTWESMQDFVTGMFSFYFGNDVSGLDMSDVFRVVWLPTKYRTFYSHPNIGLIIDPGNTPTSKPASYQANKNQRAFYDPESNSVSYANIDYMMVVDRFLAYRFSKTSFGFHNQINRKVGEFWDSAESFAIVYVLHHSNSGLYAFYIKPLGQDTFVIRQDVRVEDTHKLYAVFEDFEINTRRKFKNITDSGAHFGFNNNSAKAYAVLNRVDFTGDSLFLTFVGQGVQTPKFRIRFMWVDDNGYASPMSSAYIGTRETIRFAPEFIVRSDK